MTTHKSTGFRSMGRVASTLLSSLGCVTKQTFHRTSRLESKVILLVDARVPRI
ncbi:MAG: hypothetical protein ND866_04950 [Pyrinomonadaceae bacterium]|nr:hypothetical protein [Pyrinomonadaceae bacterium]